MRIFLLTLLLCLVLTVQTAFAQSYEYMQITAVESVVPMGLGRSRLITTSPDNQIVEKELKNFFSAVGINFSNIQNNDQEVSKRLNELVKEGWVLDQVTSSAYSADKSTGIYITRYILRRTK